MARCHASNALDYIPCMREVNLRNADLNLLVVLDALLDERSVTRGAMRLGMSQPAAAGRSLARGHFSPMHFWLTDLADTCLPHARRRCGLYCATPWQASANFWTAEHLIRRRRLGPCAC